MTFGNLEDGSESADGDALMAKDTLLLEGTAATGATSRLKLATVTTRMTDGKKLENSSTKTGLDSVTYLSTDDASA